LRPRPGLPAAALGLVALLAVVALASRGHGGFSGGVGSGPSHTTLNYLLSTYLVLGLLVFVFLLYLLITDQERRPRRSKRREIRQLVSFFIVVIALLLIFGGRHFHWLDRLRHQQSQTQTTGKASDERHGAKAPNATQPLAWTWIPAIVIVVLAGTGVAAYLVLRRRAPTASPAETMAEALADVLDDALDELRAERDPRRAIIAAYARMERLLAASGVPRQPAEAPFEYLGRVLLELDVSRTATFELTDLFERAKFSRQEIGPDLRDEAIEALVTVRDELREPAMAA
jgi:heme/copper-type cytochrome/quinol oxidase subunit 2